MAKKKKDEDEILLNSDVELFEELAQDADDHIKGSGQLLSEEDVDASKTEFISTGSRILDTITTNRADKGGFPVGRISEVVGWESSGKSLIGICACADTQRKGGIPVYYDIEKAMALDFMAKMGVKVYPEKQPDGSILGGMVYNRHLQTIEEVIERFNGDIKKIIDKQLAQKKKNRRIVTVVLDSLASTISNDNLEAEIGARQYANVARILSLEIPKLLGLIQDANVCFIVLNQLREKPNVTYGDKYYSPGGNAMKFYASLRLFMTKGARIVVGKDTPKQQTIGFNTTVVTKKNKISAPDRTAKFDIYFRRGIVDDSGFLDILKQTGVVNRPSKTTQELVLATGETKPFRLGDWSKVVKEHYDYILAKTQEALILDLSNPDLEEHRDNSTEGPSADDLLGNNGFGDE